MAATKTILAFSDTGQTLYAVVRRGADGYLLNDADGAFAAAPADPYLSFVESSTLKGLYSIAENRTAWDDGDYEVLVYSQTGGSPATAADFPIGISEMVMEDDSEISVATAEDMIGLRVLYSRLHASQVAGDKALALAIAQGFGQLRPAILDLQQSLLRGRK